MYKCNKCGSKVVIIDGKPVRECEHENEPIIAEIKASVISVGGASVNPTNKKDK